MKGLNDRLLRFIVNEFHRLLEQDQWHLDIPQVGENVWKWFIDTGVLSGRFDAPGFAENRDDYLSVEWRPDGWPYLHPVQDVDAKIKKIKAGLSSQTQTAAEEGEFAEEIDKQNAEDKKRHEDMGLNYDLSSQADPTPPADPASQDAGAGGPT